VPVLQEAERGTYAEGRYDKNDDEERAGGATSDKKHCGEKQRDRDTDEERTLWSS
jgi:hypothetical protein